MKREFSTLDIVKRLGIPRERLREWMNRNFIIPTKPSKKQGSKAIFTREDVYGIALFKDLIERGVKRETASHYVNELIKYSAVKLKDFILFRYQTQYGKQEILSMNFIHLQSGSWQIDLETGSHVPLFGESNVFPLNPCDTPLDPNKDWDEIIIINFERLKRKADYALEGLE